MANDFQYDVFLSHSAKDKAVVRPLAERLRQNGLKVWFDEWVIELGDSIPAKIEKGPFQFGTRNPEFGIPRLCVSANAFGSDWAHSHQTRPQPSTLNPQPTCAPLNQERRFIPLRLDDAPPRCSEGELDFRISDSEIRADRLLPQL